MSQGDSSRRGDGVFSGRAVGLLIAVGLLSFVAAAMVAIYADPQTEGTYGTNAYSYSAIGHKAWTEILEDLDTPILISRNDSAERSRTLLRPLTTTTMRRSLRTTDAASP